MILIIGCIFLGYLSKQSFVIYVAFIPLLFMFSRDAVKSLRRVAFAAAGLIGGIVIVMLLKRMMLEGASSERAYLYYENPLIDQAFSGRFAAAFSTGAEYFKLLFNPFRLSSYYGFDTVAIAGWGVSAIIGFVIHALLFFFALRFFRKKPEISLAIFFYLINILLVCNLFVLMPGIIAERFIFAGSAGLCLAIGYFAVRFGTVEGKFFRGTYNMKFISGALIVLMVCWSVKTIARNKDWKNEFRLVSADSKTMISSAKLHDLHATILLKKLQLMHGNKIGPDPLGSGRSKTMINYLDRAETEASLAVTIYHGYLSSWNNLGTIYFIKKDLHKAELCYLQVIKQDRVEANAHFNLGNIYAMQLKVDAARHYYEKALKINPAIPDLIPVYKQFVIRNGKLKEGIGFTENLIRLHPENYDLYLLIVDFYNSAHDERKMLDYLEKYEKIKPDAKIRGYIEILKKNIKNYNHGI
jgi:tetratricopeptide (TPR) repeat protein